MQYRMKNKTLKSAYTACLLGCLLGAARVFAVPSEHQSLSSERAATAAMSMLILYEGVLDTITIDPDRGGDIRLVCSQHVLKKWIEAYLAV